MTTRIEYVDRAGPGYEHITHLGNASGRWSVADVIARKRAGEFFYTWDGKEAAAVDVVDNRYLRSAADASRANNLLSLPAFPAGIGSLAYQYRG